MSSASAPAYHLERSASRGYVVHYRKDMWDSSTTDALAAHAYTLALAAETHGAVSAKPDHVAIAVLRDDGGASAIIGPRRFLEFDERVAADVAARRGVSVVFAMEACPSARSMRCVGGVELGVFLREASPVEGRKRRLHGTYCSSTAFYNTQLLDSEQRAAAAPARMGGSGGDANNSALLAHPRDFQFAPPQNLSMLTEMVRARIPLDQLLMQRFEALDSAEAVRRGSGAAVSEHRRRQDLGAVIAHGLCRGLDDVIYGAANVVSHWLMRRFVVAGLPEDSRTRQWVAHQEAALMCDVTWYGRAPTPDFLQPVLGPMGIVRETARAAAAGLPSKCRAGGREWYSIDVIDAANYSLESVVSKLFSTPLARGRVFLMPQQVADECLPICITHAVLREGLDGDSSDVALVDNENEGDDEALVRAATEIVSSCTERFSAAGALRQGGDKYLPLRSGMGRADGLALPDIEDIAEHRAMPLCAAFHENKMRRKRHIKHHERYQFTRFLRDVGFADGDIVAHLRKHFVGATPDRMNAYEREISRSEGGNNWDGDTRTVPYSYGCSRLVKGDISKGPGNEVGCPLAFLDAGALDALIARCYPALSKPHVAAVVAQAKSTGGATDAGCATSACSSLFRLTHGGQLPAIEGRSASFTWRPHAPRAYVAESLRLSARADADGGAAE